ncbi:MAG: ATP-binding protein [Limisphaerales bacterium]
MKTLVVITQDPRFTDALRIGLDAASYHVRVFGDLVTATEGTAGGVTDSVILTADVGLTRAMIATARRAFPESALVAVGDGLDETAQEDLLTAGASQVFGNGLNPSVMAAWLANQPARVIPTAPAPLPTDGSNVDATLKPLEVIGELSSLLSGTLDPEELTREFMLQVRRIIGANRMALFLRADASADEFTCAFATGRRVDVFRDYGLTLYTGLGKRIADHGRIVLRGAEADEDVARVFADVGADVAVPVLDREELLGVALLDRRVSGQAYSERELTLLFNVFEVFGLALRNSRQHVAIERSEELSSGVFDSLSSGCVMVSADHEILHANPAVRELFSLPDRFTLQDLPQVIGSKLFSAKAPRGASERFPYRSPDEREFEVLLRDIPHPHVVDERAMLVVIDDVTGREKLRRMEADAAQSSLVRSMAEHLAHEIGNTLVPLSTGQQLMASGTADAETLKGLESVFGSSVRRIARLTGQMQFLSRKGLHRIDDIELAAVIDDAFEDALGRVGDDAKAELNLKGADGLKIAGERAGLKQAFSEILLNSLQASPEGLGIEVHCRVLDRAGAAWIELEFVDHGEGFSEEPMKRGLDPFYSGRSVGLGLGLAVAQRVTELHGGEIELKGDRGDVCVRLPKESVFSAAQ